MKNLAPALFIGHGSPMNVILKNHFNENIAKLGKAIDQKNIHAILCISAHYQTTGINIDGQTTPKTIHDFYGFPEELYQMEYKAKGSPDTAKEVALLLKDFKPTITTNWGLDHGAWNVLWHLVPDASIPVVMLSLDYNLSFADHFKLGSKLKSLREKGVMILSSGNVVHSFRGIQFKDEAIPRQESIDFENYVKENIHQNNFESLIKFQPEIYEAAKFSVNSAEHYLPLLYTLGASYDDEKPYIFNDDIVFSTLSMLSVGYGVAF